jgi:ketosteroid isomerase-like protein
MPDHTSAVASPQDIAERIRASLIGKDANAGLYADDAVYETPFALPGAVRRIEGRDAIEAHMAARAGDGMSSMLDIQHADAVIHTTADPEVVVLETEVHGVNAGTGEPFRFASSIGVLRVRQGKIVSWRDYPNFLGGAEAAGALPQLGAMLAGSASA